MAWCPKCKREYYDEITECKECNIPLIDGEESNYRLLITDSNEAVMTSIYNYFNDNTNYTVRMYINKDKGTYDIYTVVDELENISKALVLFLQEELANSEDNSSEVMELLEESQNVNSSSATYISAKDKYEEAQSSAYSTLAVGIAGMIFMILKFCGISFVSFSGMSDILFNITMTTVFGSFVIIGIVTQLSSKKIKAGIVVEETLIDDLKTYIDANIKAEEIDAECNFTDESEELKYFAREAHIKEKLYAEFDIADETLVDQLLDEYYPIIFSK